MSGDGVGGVIVGSGGFQYLGETSRAFTWIIIFK